MFIYNCRYSSLSLPWLRRDQGIQGKLQSSEILPVLIVTGAGRELQCYQRVKSYIHSGFGMNHSDRVSRGIGPLGKILLSPSPGSGRTTACLEIRGISPLELYTIWRSIWGDRTARKFHNSAEVGWPLLTPSLVSVRLLVQGEPRLAFEG